MTAHFNVGGIAVKNSLVDFWSRCDLQSMQKLHPDDERFLAGKPEKLIFSERVNRFADYINAECFGRFDDSRFHLSLLPIPYGGDLAKADIIVLLLNPGFSFTDYYGETEVPVYRTALENNLRQTFEDTEFPFLWLNPDFCWHGGFCWWEKKLRPVLTRIADEKYKGRYLEAMKSLSKRLAIIELIPYHSVSFRGHGLIKALPSSVAARNYVHGTLLPKAIAGQKTIILTRQETGWGLSETRDNIVIYKGGQTRGASLGKESLGGNAILRRYGIK